MRGRRSRPCTGSRRCSEYGNPSARATRDPVRESLRRLAQRQLAEHPGELGVQAGGALCFEVEQCPLALQTAPVAGEGSIGSNGTVTWHDDRYGRTADGGADRAGPVTSPNGARKPGVADRGTVGDLLQLSPYAALELGPDEIELELERLALAGEVRLELLEHGGERAGAPVGPRAGAGVPGELQARQTSRAPDQREWAKRAVVDSPEVIVHVD